MRLALYEPDIPQNTGAIMRLAACLDVPLDLIEPMGFILDDRRLRRGGLDYLDLVHVTRHSSWSAYRAERAGKGARLVLVSTRGARAYTEFIFEATDTLLLGRESAGVPDGVRALCDASIAIPMRKSARSLNVALAAAIVLAEALRQTGGFPVS